VLTKYYLKVVNTLTPNGQQRNIATSNTVPKRGHWNNKKALPTIGEKLLSNY